MNYIKDFAKGMRAFGEAINALVVFISLSVVYFGAVSITAAYVKLKRKKLFDTEKKESYWTVPNKDENYLRQF